MHMQQFGCVETHGRACIPHQNVHANPSPLTGAERIVFGAGEGRSVLVELRRGGHMPHREGGAREAHRRER